MAPLTEQAKAEVILDGKKANATIKEIENAVKALTAEWRKCATGTQEFSDKGKEIQKLNTKLADTRAQTKAMTDEMKKGQMNMEGLLHNLKDKVLEFGGVLAAAFAVEKIAEYFKEGIKKAIELRDTEKILLLVLDKNKLVQKELIDLAKERSGVTTNGRLELEQAEKFLAIQGRTPDQIRKTIVAAQDLAVVTGQKLQQAVEDLDGTMEGRLSKGLQKLSSQFKDLSKDQLYHGDAIDIIATKYKGLAEDEAKTIEGQQTMAEKSWSALQRTLGNYLLGSGSFYSSVLSGAKGVFDSMSKSVARLNEESKTSVTKFAELGASVASLVSDTAPLLTRYDELKAKTVLNNDEQAELKRIIGDVTAAMPGAADAFDKYGNAISISSDRVRDYIKNQMILLRYENKKAIDETISDLAKVNVSIAKEKYKMDEIAKKGTFKEKNILGEQDYSANANPAEIAAEVAANQERINTQIALTTKLGILKGDALQQSLDNYKKEKDAADKAAEQAKKSAVEKKEFTKMSVDELNNIISRGREADATNSDRTAMRQATDELAHRTKSNDKIKESFKNLMDSLKEMENKNYAEKLTQTQQDIRLVEDKYNTLIEKALKYRSENEKALSPAQKKGIDDNISTLEVARDAQVKQVMVQAEKQFADDVKMIHENLRVARMAVTQRQIYEVNKKYADARKEMYSAINFAYDEEIKAANGNADKIILAATNKAERLKAIKKDVDKLKSAQDDELIDTQRKADLKFDEDLNTLKLKGDKDLADGKLKIQLEVNAKYRKLLEDNVSDEQKTSDIKIQMAQEVADKQAQLTIESNKKLADSAISVAKGAVDGLSSIYSMQNEAENQELKADEEANNTKKENLKKQLDAGIINKAQYDSKTAKMDAEIAAKKKKLDHDQAQRAKEIALFNALINVAGAVAAALTAGPGTGIVLSIITAALGAIQVGYILSQKVPQAAKGRYSVIGQDDNKLYKDVPMVPQPGTGLYSSPTLISETGSEYVIDPKTTRNLMVNYPHVIDAINYARVPQFSSGSYPQSSSSSTTIQPLSTDQNQALLDALTEFNKHSRNGTRSYMVYDDFRKADDTMRTIESDVSKS